ncbi:MAG: Phosphoribosyltransferase [Promethearchaeota archaeon]|nr:MAG: Phosphoribosyltransferase [Candidatus Lokiarchaeota archaeon]
MKYKNRRDAGKHLVDNIKSHLDSLEDSLIIAIPRGGVPIAYEVSKNIGVPFYLAITKKLTLPSSPEVAIGAIAADGSYELNKRVQKYRGISDDVIQEAKKHALEKVKKRLEKYTEGKEPIVENKKVIVIDDGIATGYTALVTGKYVRNRGADTIILAIPVCPKSSIKRIRKVYNKVICPLRIKTYSFAVGRYYDDFHQNNDKELYEYLQKAHQEELLYTHLE